MSKSVFVVVSLTDEQNMPHDDAVIFSAAR